MPSSYSVTSIEPAWRAARKCGSIGFESSVTNPKTACFTLPVAHRMPTSGPPYETTVRSFSDDRAIARTSDMGFRREPHPPIPIVMPSESDAMTSSWVRRLSVLTCRRSFFESCVPLVDEGLARFIRNAGQVQLVSEPLLEAIRLLHVDGIDPVQRFLGAPD